MVHHTRNTTVVVVFILCLAVLTGPAAGEVAITAPVVIDQPGSYRLTNDLVNATNEFGVRIQASDVFLDGSGHTLDGALLLNTTGVLVENASVALHNITITNLTLAGWESGIGIRNVTDAHISGVRTNGNNCGMEMIDAARTTVEGCTVTGNIAFEKGGVPYGGTGIDMTDSPGSRIMDTNVSNNGWGEELPLVGGTGILTQNDNGLLVSGCTVNHNLNTGFWIQDSKDVQILDNRIADNEGNGGIFMVGQVTDPVMNATVLNNTISGSGWGIWLIYDGYTVRDNTVSGCGYGILLDTGRNDVLTGNVLHDNDENFGVSGAEIAQYYHTVSTTNTVDGKPIYYLTHQSAAVVDGATGAGVVYAIDCPGITIRDISTSRNMNGVFLWGCDGAVITNVSASASENGLSLIESDAVRIDRSHARENTLNGYLILDAADLQMTESEAVNNRGSLGNGNGIYVQEGYQMVLADVNTSGNSFAGCYLDEIDHLSLVNVTATTNGAVGVAFGGEAVTVTGCTIRDNTGPGIGMLDTTGVAVWNNYFSNAMNLDLSQGTITNASWNVSLTAGPNIVGGPFIGGNYWATPTGTGWSQVTPDRGDGICTEPYVLDVGNTDYLPLHQYPGPVPEANFSATPTSGYSPLMVQFHDESTGTVTGWHWSFGDGETSDLQHPAHNYRGARGYAVTLNVTGPAGAGELTRDGYIVVNRPVSDDDDGMDAVTVYDETGALVTTWRGTVVFEVRVEADDTVGELVVDSGVTAHTATGDPLREVTITPTDIPVAGDGTAIAFTDYVYTCGPAGATFSPPAELVLSFTAAEWAALTTDGRPLVVMTYREETGTWEEVLTVVNAAARTVTATLSHFSLVALVHTTAEEVLTPVVTPEETPTATPTPVASPATPVPTTPVTPSPTATGPAMPVSVLLVVSALLGLAGIRGRQER